VIDCDAHRNHDLEKNGRLADGLVPEPLQGLGNVFVGCRAGESSDDGGDAFDGPETVVIGDAGASRDGVCVWDHGGFDGNGDGCKLGGNAAAAHRHRRGSVASGNVGKGFDQDSDAGGLTVLNCTGSVNGTDLGLGNPVLSGERHRLRNDVSIGADGSIANADDECNSWGDGLGVSAADFVSLDLSRATGACNPDGTLLVTGLFRRVATGVLGEAGIDVGLADAGAAPELGVFALGA